MDEGFEDDTEFEDASDEAESLDDDFTAKDAFFIGVGMGFAYEEGLRAWKRRKRKRFGDDGP